MKLDLKQLDAYIANLEAMALGASAVPEGLTQESKDKLEHLRLSGRDFFEITPQLALAAIRYAKVKIITLLTSGRKVSKQELWSAMADGIGKQILLRFSSGGNDASFVPLKSSTLANKSRHGQSSAIGVATGKLLDNMRAAKWRVE